MINLKRFKDGMGGRGAFEQTPILDFFGLKSERLRQLPKALAQLFSFKYFAFCIT